MLASSVQDLMTVKLAVACSVKNAVYRDSLVQTNLHYYNTLGSAGGYLEFERSVLAARSTPFSISMQFKPLHRGDLLLQGYADANFWLMQEQCLTSKFHGSHKVLESCSLTLPFNH